MAVNIEKAIDYMYELKSKGITYSMTGSRTGEDGTGDCSGTIYTGLRKGGATNAGWVLNTDSMHTWLEKNRFKLIADNETWDAKRGDITIFGKRGSSGGTAGHVVLWISNSQYIHCTWKNYQDHGIRVDYDKNNMGLYNMMYYTYRIDGKAPKPSKSPKKPVSKPVQKSNDGWTTKKGKFKTGTSIWLRKGASTSSGKISLIESGQFISYNAYKHSGGYMWIRQPRAGSTYGYMAVGKSSRGKLTESWGVM